MAQKTTNHSGKEGEKTQAILRNLSRDGFLNFKIHKAGITCESI